MACLDVDYCILYGLFGLSLKSDTPSESILVFSFEKHQNKNREKIIFMKIPILINISYPSSLSCLVFDLICPDRLLTAIFSEQVDEDL